MSTIRITPAMVEAFMEASHDQNPLHIDADYARRSPFGKPVVYGVLGILAAMARWLDGRGIALAQIRAVFKKPLFVGEEYILRIDERGDRIQLALARGPVDYLQLSFQIAVQPNWVSGPAFGFNPDDLPSDIGLRPEFRYAPRSEGLAKLAEALNMRVGQLPLGQWSALLWSSYWVGMVLPGKRALFAELAFLFDGALQSPGLELRISPADFDSRFNRFVQMGSGTGISELRLATFVRPEPVKLDWDLLRGGKGNAWTGKRVFISGAARGLGAAMAAAAGLQGANLALNYRGDASGMAAFLGELHAEGIAAEAFAADLTRQADVESMAASIAQGAKLDLIVLNATPAIRNAWFLEQMPADFMDFFTQSSAMTLQTLRALLPHAAADATILLISTNYLSDPQRGFTHYLAAKAAQEALIEALSTETRGIRHVAARLPRLLSDQTNLPFDPHAPARAETVAIQLLATVKDLPALPAFQRVEIALPEMD